MGVDTAVDHVVAVADKAGLRSSRGNEDVASHRPRSSG